MPRKAPPPLPAGLTRRKFAQHAAWAGLSAAFAATPVAGNAQASKPPEKPSLTDSEARYQQIMRKYGDRLSEEQRKRVLKILAYNEKLLAPIRSFPLDNGQPAATVLKFYEEASTTPRVRPRSGRPSSKKA